MLFRSTIRLKLAPTLWSNPCKTSYSPLLTVIVDPPILNGPTLKPNNLFKIFNLIPLNAFDPLASILDCSTAEKILLAISFLLKYFASEMNHIKGYNNGMGGPDEIL